MARYCVRKKTKEAEVLDLDEKIASGTRSLWGVPSSPESDLEPQFVETIPDKSMSRSSVATVPPGDQFG